MAIEPRSYDILALDELAKTDPNRAEIMKLLYFAGLTPEQAAQVLDISPATANCYWVYAKAWLFRRIQQA